MAARSFVSQLASGASLGENFAVREDSGRNAAIKDALARGVKLGGPKMRARKVAVEAIEANADRYAANVLPIIPEVQRAGATSLRAIADVLNARGVATARGGRLQASVAPLAGDRKTRPQVTGMELNC